MRIRILMIVFTFVSILLSEAMGQNTITFTYAGDDTGKMTAYGSALNERHDAAICINEPLLSDYKIKKITAYLRPNTYSLEPTVWVSSGLYLNNNVNNPDIFESEKLQTTSGQFYDSKFDKIEYTFDNPIPMGDKPMYVGYSFTGTTTLSYNAIYMYLVPHDNAFFYHGSTSSRTWTDNSAKGSLMIVVELEGETSKKAINIASIDNCYTVLDEPFETTAHLINPIGESVSEIEYTYTVDDNQAISKLLKLDSPIAANPTLEVPVKLNFEGVDELGTHKVRVCIDKVNGVENASNRSEYEFEAIGVPFLPKHRTLVEEYTGLWCGYCPSGYVALQEINRCFRHDVVVISYHYNDALFVTSSYPMTVTNYPKLSIDRFALLDPLNGTHGYRESSCGVILDIEDRMQDVPVADVEVKNVFLSSTSLSFDIDVTFIVDMQNANYQLGYAITANGLTSSQSQKNYYSGMGGAYKGSILEPFTQYGSDVSGLVYDDVLVSTGTYKGEVNSIPSQVNAGEVMTRSYTVPLSYIRYCKDPEMLVINAFVIDKNTSHIVNANKAYASEKGIPEYDDGGDNTTSRIDVITDEAVSTECFDLTGNKVKNPTYGVFILKKTLKDGRIITEKIIK